MQLYGGIIEKAIKNLARDPFATVPIPPEKPVMRDMRTVLSMFPDDFIQPEVEWSRNGAVTLRWVAREGRSGFTLIIDGSRSVYGVTSCLKRIVPPWKHDVLHFDKIRKQLADPLIEAIVTGRQHHEAA